MKLKVGDTIEFRGCCFHADWEFDMPCVLYKGAKATGYGGNSGEIYNMIENILINACLDPGHIIPDGFSEFDLAECKAYGWYPKGFRNRKNATHVRVIVEILPGDYDGELDFEVIKTEQKQGPFD